MLDIVKNQEGDVTVITMKGSIQESVDLLQILGPPAPNMKIHTKGIKRISSDGVKSWIHYFQAAHQQGSQLTFVACSIAIVEQINLISNFIAGGTVESIYVPFTCTKCSTELLGLFQCEAIREANLQIPSFKCAKCGGQAVFDDIPDQYLGFLKR